VSPVVDGDAHGLSESWGELGELELLESESSAELDFAGILSSLSLNQWSQLGERPWEGSLGFGSSVISSYLLVGGLVEEASHSSHPMFSQMRALKDIIVFYHVAY